MNQGFLTSEAGSITVTSFSLREIHISTWERENVGRDFKTLLQFTLNILGFIIDKIALITPNSEICCVALERSLNLSEPRVWPGPVP